jgi:hypothetical protein
MSQGSAVENCEFREGRAREGHDFSRAASPHKRFVIPNRAESRARNLLYASTTTNEGAPSFAHFAKEPALSEAEGWDSTTPPL